MLGYEFCVKSCINRCKKQRSEDDNNNNDEQTHQRQVRNSSVLLFNNISRPLLIIGRSFKAHQQCRELMIVLWIQQLSFRERL